MGCAHACNGRQCTSQSVTVHMLRQDQFCAVNTEQLDRGTALCALRGPDLTAMLGPKVVFQQSTVSGCELSGQLMQFGIDVRVAVRLGAIHTSLGCPNRLAGRATRNGKWMMITAMRRARGTRTLTRSSSGSTRSSPRCGQWGYVGVGVGEEGCQMGDGACKRAFRSRAPVRILSDGVVVDAAVEAGRGGRLKGMCPTARSRLFHAAERVGCLRGAAQHSSSSSGRWNT